MEFASRERERAGGARVRVGSRQKWNKGGWSLLLERERVGRE